MGNEGASRTGIRRTSTALFQAWSEAGLVWLPELGIGYYPVTEAPYDAAYFAKYQAYANTELGRAITQARVELVKRYHEGEVLDVGIGSGAFVEAHGAAHGFDINPAGKAWLDARWSAWDGEPVAAVTFWDSLEHIADPAPLLAVAERWAFVSAPIVQDVNAIATWKHFRRDEHCWYFTADGLVRFMHAHGFEFVARDDFETRLGREDIGTFVFERT